jgi:hypothetical protein
MLVNQRTCMTPPADMHDNTQQTCIMHDGPMQHTHALAPPMLHTHGHLPPMQQTWALDSHAAHCVKGVAHRPTILRTARTRSIMARSRCRTMMPAWSTTYWCLCEHSATCHNLQQASSALCCQPYWLLWALHACMRCMRLFMLSRTHQPLSCTPRFMEALQALSDLQTRSGREQHTASSK